eukprot:jgi/Tetstr1/434352/TSEL_023456.t1
MATDSWLKEQLFAGRPQGKMGSENKRRERDVMKLMMNDYKVEMVNDRINEFHVEFVGPKDSPYEGGHWKLHVQLSDAYPYESPSITFVNRIYHPNVHKSAGHVCLDVINENWSPMFDLVNVFEVFLPQLLLYPNTAHGLNDEAAAMLMHEPTAFNKKVQEYVQRYAKAEDIHAVWGGMMPFAQQLMMMTRLLSATPALGEVIPLTKRTRQPLPIREAQRQLPGLRQTYRRPSADSASRESTEIPQAAYGAHLQELQHCGDLIYIDSEAAAHRHLASLMC